MAEDMDILVGVKVDGTQADIQRQIDDLAKKPKIKTGVSLSFDDKDGIQKEINAAVRKLTRPTIHMNVELEKGALARIKQQIENGLSGVNLPAVNLSQALFGGTNGAADVQRQVQQVEKVISQSAKTLQHMSRVSYDVSSANREVKNRLLEFGLSEKDADALVKQIETGGFKIAQARARFAQQMQKSAGGKRQLSDKELLQSISIAGTTEDGISAVRTLTRNARTGEFAMSTQLGATLNEQGKTIKLVNQATVSQKQINKLMNELRELRAQAFERGQKIKSSEATSITEEIATIEGELNSGTADIAAISSRVERLKTTIKNVKEAHKAASKLKNVSVADKVAEVESAVETRRQEANRLIGALNADHLVAQAQKVQDALDAVDSAFTTAHNAKSDATSDQWNAYTKAVDNYQQAVKQATQAQKDFQTQQKLTTKGNDLVTNLTKAGMATEATQVQTALKGVADAAKKLQNSTNPADLQAYAQAMSTLEDAVTANEAALRNYNKEQAVFAKARKDMQIITKIRNEWSKAMSNADNADWLERISAGLQSMDASQVKKASQELRVFQAQMRATGQATETFGNKMKRFFKEFTQWFSVSQTIMKAIQGVKTMASNVTAIDSSMTELRKVTDETSTSYARFSEQTEQTAKNLKTSITDVIDATSGWSRLGYTLSDAEALGKWSTIYANVGDDIASVDDATQNLVSTLKGFGTEGNTVVGQVERIVDMFNKVGNSTSISSGKIGESLQNSASAMKEANNTLSETVALTVGAYDVTQSAGEVGNMWKSVSLRIRGAKTELEAAGEDTEGIVESTAKLRDYVKGMTGFDIMENADEFKSTYDIIVGIGKVWADLSDIEQASLLEKLAGKNRANALAAALNNVEEIERAYKLAEESAGSASAEYDVYTQSVEAHAKQMEASMQSFSKSVLSKDIINTGYDMGSGLLDMLTGIADTLGSIPTLATAAMTAVTLFTGKGRSIVIYAPLRESPLAA